MKTEFLGSIFKSSGKTLCQLVEKETGKVFYVLAPLIDTRKDPIKIGNNYNVTMSSNKRMYFKRIKPIKTTQKQINKILEEIEKLFSNNKKKEVG